MPFIHMRNDGGPRPILLRYAYETTLNDDMNVCNHTAASDCNATSQGQDSTIRAYRFDCDDGVGQLREELLRWESLTVCLLNQQ